VSECVCVWMCACISLCVCVFQSSFPLQKIESGISAAGLIPAASVNDDPTKEKQQGTAPTRLSTRVCVCVCVCVSLCVCVERDSERLSEEEEEEWQNEAPASENLSLSFSSSLLQKILSY